jgi:hypothetical protein
LRYFHFTENNTGLTKINKILFRQYSQLREICKISANCPIVRSCYIVIASRFRKRKGDQLRKPVGTPSTVQVAVQKPKEEIKVPDVKVGDKVKHKTFGEGTISFMDKAQKKIRVQFHVGEKMFLYPDAFVNGHLSV